MNHLPLEVRCRISADALDLCHEATDRYDGADRSERAGYSAQADRLRDRTVTIICTHLAEQAWTEGRR